MPLVKIMGSKKLSQSEHSIAITEMVLDCVERELGRSRKTALVLWETPHCQYPKDQNEGIHLYGIEVYITHKENELEKSERTISSLFSGLEGLDFFPSVKPYPIYVRIVPNHTAYWGYQ